MDDLPTDYTEHNLPLVLLSGLGDEDNVGGDGSGLPRQGSGTKLVIQTPECEGERARHLLQQFVNRDGSLLAWNSNALPGPTGTLKFRMQAIGRNYTLPPRKAAPLAQSPSAEAPINRSRSPSKSAELHSPLSPLSPGSPIFPDGVFTPLWLAKHQRQIPAVFVAFFDIKADDKPASDDQLKADINSVRAAISRSGFKTRFAAVLLSDKSILHAADLEDRLASIRRVTNLDSKTSLFFMPPVSSQSEMGAFVQGVLSALQPSVIEYYRDLTKHARRKKTRGSIPLTATAPASQTLSNVGWNVRYEVKQGVFAEFRQEMDVAERHYSQAIEDLFNPEGIFETTPSWSPRWDEARLLCDTLALRVIRCQLWNNLTTGAAQSWSNYRLRMRDLVDRRGKGSQTYGWEAWESRWAKAMAELTRRADLPAFRNQMKQPLEDLSESAGLGTFAAPEKAISTNERLPPFTLLHHAGYWLRLAIKGTRSRWQRALTIPTEDRSSPDGSPASAVAKRSRAYDTYLVPPPHKEFPLPEKQGIDHVTVIAELSEHAIREFNVKGQNRLSEQTRLDAGRDLVNAGRFEDAMTYLLPLWENCSWRTDNWNSLYGELLSEVHRCAQHIGKADLVLKSTWELLGATPASKQNDKLNITQCIDYVPNGAAVLSVQCKDRGVLSPITASFAFANKQGFVGEPLGCQLALISKAQSNTEPLTLSKVELVIDTVKKIEIVHNDDKAADQVSYLRLEDTSDLIKTAANLTLMPHERRIFNLALIFREAQAVKLQEAILVLTTDNFNLRHSFTSEPLLQTPVWQFEADGELVPSSLNRDESTTVEVLPKPPKIQILLHGLHPQYYVGEQVRLQVELVNGETDKVNGTVRQSVVAQDDIVLPSKWMQAGDIKTDNQLVARENTVEQHIDELQSSEVMKLDLIVDAPTEPLAHTLTFDVDYTLASEPSTPLRKTLVVELAYATLFEAKFNFGPLVHSEPWPSYFDPELLSAADDEPSGIPQRWRLGSQITSVASEDIHIKGAEIVIDRIANDATFKVLESSENKDQILAPITKIERSFQILTQKLSLDDRRPTILELSLAVSWARDADSTINTTKVTVPRLNMPSSEPRVLCIAAVSEQDTSDILLQYYLENPSTHFLTFVVTLEANDDFAFSGPKHRTLSLAPFSRHLITYNLLVHGNREETKLADGQGRWIWPVLQVLDSYFQKSLRVLAAGPGVRVDPQRGLGVWVPAPKI